MLYLFLKQLNPVPQKFQFLIEDRETKIGKGKRYVKGKGTYRGNSSEKNSEKFNKVVEKENLINKIECCSSGRGKVAIDYHNNTISTLNHVRFNKITKQTTNYDPTTCHKHDNSLQILLNLLIENNCKSMFSMLMWD